jgi:hypothetical protein
MRWFTSPVDAEAAGRLARELEISPRVAGLLVQRGLAEPAAAYTFLLTLDLRIRTCHVY